MAPDHRPFLIGLAGGSSSGKTTVAERLTVMAGDRRVALLKLDSYYLSHPELSFDERSRADYDHPAAFDWSLLEQHVDRLSQGLPIEVPVYDFANHLRSDEVVTVTPAPIIVVEGILVLADPNLRDRFDLKVYVDTEADLRFIRRVLRDTAERGRTVDSVIAQYLETVRPAHDQFIEPSKRFADVIIPHGGLNEPAIDVLLARVRELAL